MYINQPEQKGTCCRADKNQGSYWCPGLRCCFYALHTFGSPLCRRSVGPAVHNGPRCCKDQQTEPNCHTQIHAEQKIRLLSWKERITQSISPIRQRVHPHERA